MTHFAFHKLRWLHLILTRIYFQKSILMQILPATHTDVLKNIHKSCSPEYKCYHFNFRHNYISWPTIYDCIFNQNRCDSWGIKKKRSPTVKFFINWLLQTLEIIQQTTCYLFHRLCTNVLRQKKNKIVMWQWL